MRIQHNIMALNAYRQLGGNNSALAKNLEKLSSGYAINRAGDDAAGLAISEKMRAQIKGLEAAQKNANDGISLVQTAEGALTEVHSMLNRMVYLATQSANGTYDNEVDRANLDKEVQTLKEEIDRISKSTNFNGLKLLDGSMDADATKTTGGTTDVPILQNVATDPTHEVGSATVLHKDAPEKGPTEINVELHNVEITTKSKEGDVIKFQVGDNTVELELGAATGTSDPDTGKLIAGKNYTTEDIAKAIAAKFNETGNNLISGQEFKATINPDKTSIKFVQKNDPSDPTEVVNANVDVKIEYSENPNGNPVEYTTKIKPDALTKGNAITIGGEKLVLGDGILTGKNTLEAAFGAVGGFETKSGYKVEYDATKGELKVTDPNGTMGAPTVKFDDYATPLKMKSDVTYGQDAKQASGSYAVPKDLVKDDEVTFDGETFTVQADGRLTGGTNWEAEYKDGKVTFTAVAGAAKDGDAGNLTGKQDVKFDYKGARAMGQFNAAAADTAEIEIDISALGVGNGDTIKIGGTVDTLTSDGAGNWTSANNKYTAVETNGKLKITAAAAGVDTNAIEFAYATANQTDNKTAVMDVTGGSDATASKVEFDFTNAGLENGDKLILTGTAGSKELIWNTDLATTLADNNIDAAALAALGLGGTNAATIDAANNKITIEEGTTGAANVPSSFKIQTAKRHDTTAEMTKPANADSIIGTWNVRSTNNKQGASAGGGQLASTVFDLTSDMVKDGNKLTIGKETYVFKVGKDSTTKAAAGETIIDLSKYAADDADLVDAAGAALANQTTGNNAFTIGYSDTGKISIHEKEGQIQYVDGELNTVESFDKLVYMQSPEVTEATGKGLTFQVGDTADDFQKVALSIKDMSSEGLGIGDVNITTIEDAASAIDKIKTAINTVSSQRGDLGAIQNRLEHTINNLGVQTENITAAESRIRDTDMAQEMMAYTKNNILVQAAQAMLAQANQVPQGVLQLLQ